MNKPNTNSVLFNREGYILIQEYLDDVYGLINTKTWKIPLGIADRVHLFLLKIFIKFSWFSDNLFILNTSSLSPSYSLLTTFLIKIGLLDSVSEKAAAIPGYYCFQSEKSVVVDGVTHTLVGQGVSRIKAEALSKSLGELIERLISGIKDENKTILKATASGLKNKIYPPVFHKLLEVQKDLKHSSLLQDSDMVIGWVKGVNLVTNEDVHIPKNLTSWFSGNRKQKSVLFNATTNGISGFFTKEGAVLRGLLEVVERDAFFVHWLTTTIPDVILVRTLPVCLLKEIEEFSLRGVTLTVLNITATGIPTVCIVAINDKANPPQVVVGSASSVNFKEAIEAALREVSKMMYMFSYTPKVKDVSLFIESQKVEPFVSNLDKKTRQLYWQGQERINDINWFISGKSVSYESVTENDLGYHLNDKQSFQVCVEKLKKLGEDYYPSVYYPENVLQNVLGFYIAQVYIPKAFPLFLVEKYGTFKSDRLEDFIQSKNITNWKLNSQPHMFL